MTAVMKPDRELMAIAFEALERATTKTGHAFDARRLAFHLMSVSAQAYGAYSADLGEEKTAMTVITEGVLAVLSVQCLGSYEARGTYLIEHRPRAVH